ncbi:hypothetical protein AB6A40_009836 [Gnathostoma spinigerum]|uniref:Elongation of very long chain fatty acids protein n=1 Tax=Gnathostoma spinigerum TaxID=75299 RepID=A0ABD6EVI9_9BILA
MGADRYSTLLSFEFSDDRLLRIDFKEQYPLYFETYLKPSQTNVVRFLREKWTYTLVIALLYIAVVNALVKVMKKRVPFELRKALFIWNSILAVLSLFGFVRTNEEFIYVLAHHGYYKSVCYTYAEENAMSFWAMIFAILKVCELGDTFFIVLRKRPLIFLHYYHHIFVLIYTVHAGAEQTGTARWFIWMNYLVHTLMYTYYAFTSTGR